MAAAGTPDVADDNFDECNTSVVGDKVNTGSRTNCVSAHQINDMVGNVWEWVADWMQGDTDLWAPTGSGFPAGANYGDDRMAGTNPATNAGNGQNFPGALIRGGDFNESAASGVFALRADFSPAETRNVIGFRCGREH